MLVGVSKLGEAGGFRTIRNARIDDCALARTIKQHAGRLFLGLGDDSYSIRPYTGLSDLWSMVARSAFTQLGYSWLLLAGAVSALSLIYLAPPVLSLATASHHNWATGLLALGAWTLLTLSYLPTVRRYQQPIYAALLLPFAALLYIGMTLDSAVRHLRGTDSWKGRTYQQSSPAP